ncbi:MAG TPA: hypothetical protein VEC37_16620 [Bacillota bacterium]|nr:hypothetical protein [Bacillota bacterium]
MRKLLVLLVAMVLILSVATVSLAALEVRGDFRYNFTYNGSDSALGEDKMVDDHDFRLEFVGKYSDKVVAFVRLRDAGTKGDFLDFNNNDIKDKAEEDTSISANVDQFWVSYQSKYALWKMGDFEWKILPSRDELTPNGGYCMRRTDTMISAEIPLPKGCYTGFAFIPDGNGEGSDVQDGAYALKLGYANPKYAGEVHYFDTKSTSPKNRKTVFAVDTWYKPFATVKVYLCYTDPKFVDDVANGQDPDTMLGFYWEQIMKTPLNSRFEYIVNRKVQNTMEYNPWRFSVGWDFTSNLSAGVNVTNYISTKPYEEDYAIGFGCKLKF